MESKIFSSIHAVMEDIGAIGKDKRNTQQGFMYRGVDDVMNALNPAFIKHRIFITPEVLEQHREKRSTGKGGELIYSVCKIKYTFYADDGSHVEAIVIGEGMDSGDKASNKAMSVAFKYACFQVFCIPTEEMQEPNANPVDPDRDCHEPSKTKDELATEEMKKIFVQECDRIGKSKGAVLKAIGSKSLEEMTVSEFEIAMKNFERTPSKQPEKLDAAMIPPDDYCDLPFN